MIRLFYFVESNEKVSSFNFLVETLNEFILIDSCTLTLKFLLARATVDERAMIPELLGYTLYFKFDHDFLLVNVHSGAGVGHPWFLIQYDRET